jgi:hypothetical protein
LFLLSPASCMCRPVSHQSKFSLIFFLQQEPELEPRARIRFRWVKMIWFRQFRFRLRFRFRNTASMTVCLSMILRLPVFRASMTANLQGFHEGLSSMLSWRPVFLWFDSLASVFRWRPVTYVLWRPVFYASW